MPKLPLSKDSSGTIKPIAREDNEVLTFSKSICLKVKIIAWLGVELVYHDITG